MGRLLLILGVVVGGVLFLRSRLRALKRADRPEAQSPSAGGRSAEDMVRCDHCGVHLPMADAVSDAKGWFCSTAHREAGSRHT